MSKLNPLAVTTSGNDVNADMERKFKQFTWHQNKLWVKQSMLMTVVVLGAAAVMPGQFGLGLLLVVPSVSLVLMLAIRASARKKLLGSGSAVKAV